MDPTPATAPFILQTDCTGKLTFAYFRGAWSPVSFKKSQVTRDLATKLRMCKYLCKGPDAQPACEPQRAIDTAALYFDYEPMQVAWDDKRAAELGEMGKGRIEGWGHGKGATAGLSVSECQFPPGFPVWASSRLEGS